MTLFADPRAALEAASAHDTPPHLLESLAHHVDTTVRRAVASNPNTPALVAGTLAASFPQNFLDNPALPLWLLENVNFFATLEYSSRASLARFSHVPDDVLRRLATDEDSYIRRIVAARTDLKTELIAHFIDDPSTHVRKELAENPITDVQTLDRLALDSHEWVRSTVSKHARLSATSLQLLATEKSYYIRAQVAVHENTPLPTLETLLQDGEPSVRLAIAKRQSIPEAWVARLADDEDADVRAAAAHHLPISSLLWYRRLGSSSNLREVLPGRSHLQNPQSSFDHASLCDIATEALVENRYWRLFLLAHHPYTPTDILEKLAHHKDTRIVAAVVENPCISIELLSAIAENHQGAVAKAAQTRLQYIQQNQSH